jgi:hypothetical protein
MTAFMIGLSVGLILLVAILHNRIKMISSRLWKLSYRRYKDKGMVSKH